MRIKDGFKLRTLLKEYIVTSEGTNRVDFNKIISLNSTAAFLWQKVAGTDFNEEALVNLLLEEYEVTMEVAVNDVKNLIDQFREAGILDE